MSNTVLKQSFATLLKDYALVTVGVISYALGWSVFLLPNNLVGGGVSGFASILMYATGIPMGVTYFVLNVILLIIGTKILGTGFGGKTIYAIVMTSVMLSVMPKIIPADFIHEFAVSNGKLIYYDAQSGTFLNIEEYATLEVENFEILKVDKLLLNQKMFKSIAKVL